jgi:hypothetical protein
MITQTMLDTEAMKSQELDQLAENCLKDIRLSIRKALLHMGSPQNYPILTDQNSLEGILVDLVRDTQEPDRMERLAVEGRRLSASPLAGIVYPRADILNRLDFHSRPSIHAQLSGLLDLPAQDSTAGRIMSLAGEPKSTLSYFLNEVYCAKETGLTDYGKDKLYIGGTTIDAFGNTACAGVHYLGEFNNGWKTPFNLKLAEHNLSIGAGWPRTYYYIVSISVRGSDKLYHLLDKIVQYARDYAIDYAKKFGAVAGQFLAALIGMPAIGAPLGLALGEIIGYIVDYCISAIGKELLDWVKGSTKLFNPQTMMTRLPYQSKLFDGDANRRSRNVPPWKGHRGEYKLSFSEEVDWITEFEPSVTATRGGLDLVRTHRTHGVDIKRWRPSSGWSDWSRVTQAAYSPDAPICICHVVVRKARPGRPMMGPNSELYLIAVDAWANGRVTMGKPSLTEEYSWSHESLPHLRDEAFNNYLISGSVISAVSRDTRGVDVFATALDGYVYAAAKGTQTDNKWHGWWRIGEKRFLPGASVSAVSRMKGHIDVFVVGPDGHVWSAAYGPDAAGKWEWRGWFKILNEVFVPSSRIGAISRQENQIDLFAVNMKGEVRSAAWSPSANQGKWGGWWRITESNGSFALGTPISVVSRSKSHLDVFAVGLDGCVWSAAWGPQTEHKWRGWWKIGNVKSPQRSFVTTASRGINNIDVFVRGYDGEIWSQYWGGADWKERKI